MLTQSLRRLTAMAAAVSLLAVGTVTMAEPTTPPPAPAADFSRAQYVNIGLGATNQENGIRLLESQPDGQTLPMADGSNRRSTPNQLGTARYFYFDVHDTYIHGGHNTVVLTVTYQDKGLMPVYLEYDAFDPVRPQATVPEVSRKRVLLFNRTNSEAWPTARITLEDARFRNGQPGGADFRIVSEDELVLRQVSVFRQATKPYIPIEIEIAGTLVHFDPNDVQPFVDPTTNRTLAPVRAMLNALGVADEDIHWDNETRTVTAGNGQTIIKLTIGSDIAMVNDLPVWLDQPATIVAERTVVPVRFIAERFGFKVEPFFTETRRLIRLTPTALTPAQPPLPTEPPAPIDPPEPVEPPADSEPNPQQP